jgi:CBS domain-containing protein/gamma-glutamylcysteine synthetase
MGAKKVAHLKDQSQMQHFVKHLLRDVQAFEIMLEKNWFEDDITRIGAEQEMCLVNNKTFKPEPINIEFLAKIPEYPWLTTELARFNLETNLTPQVFNGDCLSLLEAENLHYIQILRDHLKSWNADIVLTGILPTLRKFDLALSNLTPKPRYKALVSAIDQMLTSSAYELRLDGIDELLVKHDSPLLEACNTSFQVHLQVAPNDFTQLYNISQTLAAPVMAIAANSPIVFGRRLWHETRIALFQQSLDTRSSHEYLRERSPRVNFGSGWLKKSITEIYKEDISRFRVLLGDHIEEDALEAVNQGIVPKLRALQVHNSTVYRWNRPCYGISPNGKPHLRIENRVLPAGPTIKDSTANAALWLGAMVGFKHQYPDITKQISYADVRDNFGKAARFGIDTNFTWFKDKKITATDLILKEIIPLAKEGLKIQNVNPKDIDQYLGIIEERAKSHVTGARWILRSFTKLREEVTNDEAVTIITAAMIKNQKEEKPVHTWGDPSIMDLKEYEPSNLKVEEFMVTDLFTVQKDDVIELVVQMMDWRKIRYMPVENSKGELEGLISSRLLLRHFAKDETSDKVVTVEDLMIKSPLTIAPTATIVEAMEKMRENRIGCLPVVNGKDLIGIITEMDFLRITSRLIKMRNI